MRRKADTPPALPARFGADRPRLVVVDEVAIGTTLDPYLDTKAAMQYLSCCERSLRKWRADLLHPLPFYQIGGKVLYRRSDLDQWMCRHRRGSTLDPDVQRAVASILGSYPGA
jgi:Helix-turn-helix domain